jgi:guanosine-3',5'-bis(diphosphate) 3'-pyrophosphohydrolase
VAVVELPADASSGAPPDAAVPREVPDSGPLAGVAAGEPGLDGDAAAGGLGRRLLAVLPLTTLMSPRGRVGDPVADLIRAHRAIHPRADSAVLSRAYQVAERAHRGQVRKSGEPYITHPLAVARILADLGMDTTTLVAALLHDTVEDTDYELHQLHSDFGDEVAHLVDGVTKFDKMYFGDAAEAETIRKMLISAGQDVRVLVIKVADRLHNMRTLDARSTGSRERIARYTRDWLIPLCDRLGIQALKRELEDCVLQNLDPDWYHRIDRFTRAPRSRDPLDRIIADIGRQLRRLRVNATVSPRPRHYFSIWRDAVRSRDQQPYDPPRVEVVVEGSRTDCYAALGAVHGLWRPVPGRFKDFIASPKNNLYQSLHTTVLGPEHQPVEVLIRTREMATAAEYGIVTRFRLADADSRWPGPPVEPGADAFSGESLDWLRRMLDWQDLADDPGAFLESLRCDLAYGQIQAFTPSGRAVPLPEGSTPVDFAYTLDTLLGHRCVAARINARLVPLSSPLSDGDVVEIITDDPALEEFPPDPSSTARGPSRDWLEFVRSPHAQLAISRWFEGDEDGSAGNVAVRVRTGRGRLTAALRAHDRTLVGELPLVAVAEQLGYPGLESLLLAVADGRADAAELAERLIAEVDRPPG